MIIWKFCTFSCTGNNICQKGLDNSMLPFCNWLARLLMLVILPTLTASTQDICSHIHTQYIWWVSFVFCCCCCCTGFEFYLLSLIGFPSKILKGNSEIISDVWKWLRTFSFTGKIYDQNLFPELSLELHFRYFFFWFFLKYN